MQRLLPLILSLLIGSGLWAQVNEIGLTGGVCYYIGDLNPTRHYPKDMKLGGGIVFRHNINDRYAIRLQGLYSSLQAHDSNSEDSLQVLRNLHFRSKLTEVSLLLEINFFKYRYRGRDGKKWSPFIFFGLAYFRANPKALYDDTWYDLQPLGTEGQGSSAGGEIYKVDRMSVPFGAGMKFNLGRVDMQIEWGLRRTWTDYIDDVSGTYVDNDLLAFENGPLAAQLADRSVATDPAYTRAGQARGDVNTRDWYQYTGLSITYIISRFSDCDEQYNWMKRRR